MIHQYKLNGYNIVVDANSASVHSVDEVAYAAIKMIDEKVEAMDGFWGCGVSAKKAALKAVEPQVVDALVEKFGVTQDGIASESDAQDTITPEDAAELMADLAELVEAGQLWSDDPYEEVAGDLKVKQSVLKAICLHVAHGCNMDCEYCFAGKGEYSNKGILSLETGKRALDYLVENSGSRQHLEVDFFGGEPLLNWEVCKELVKYGRELEKKHNKIFNFTLTTNGVLIDQDVIDFTTCQMANVVLSMDGRRETHDRMRHTKVGGGTYDMIMDNFRRLVEARTMPYEEKLAKYGYTDHPEDFRGTSEYYMRGTYTAYNRDFAADVIQMADLGFRETSIEPVVCDPSVPYALHEEDVPQLYEEYEKLALEMLAREEQGEGFSFYHYTVDLTGGPCIYKRVSGCGVGTEYLAITPNGDIYPCHQFAMEDNMLCGNIFEGITRPEVLEIFSAGNNLYTRDECKGCWAKLYCGGGCSANNMHSNGDINKVYRFGCRLHTKRIECAIMQEVARAERNADSKMN